MTATAAAGRFWTGPAALVGGPLIVALSVRLYIGGPPSFAYDDAYISQHSAHFLTSAVDPSYHDARPMTGATSLVHVLLLWLAMQFLAAPWAVESVSWLGALAYLFGIVTFVTTSTPLSWLRWALVAIGLCVGSAAFHLAGGQETGWAMAAVIWALHWLHHDRPEHRRLAGAAGVLPWIRPDLGLLSLAVVIHRVTTARSRWRSDVLIASCVALAGLAVYQSLAGTPWPTTMQAKVQFFGEFGETASYKARVTADLLLGWLVTIGPAAIALVLAPVWSRTGKFAGAALLALILGSAVVAPSFISQSVFRYLQPLSVPLIVLTLSAAHRVGRDLLVVSTLVWSGVSAPYQLRGWVSARDSFSTTQAVVAQWLNTNVPIGTRILVHDAGFLSENTRFPLIDVVGLKSPSALKGHAAITGPSNGKRRGEVVHRLACEGNAEYFVMLRAWDESFALSSGLLTHGWSVDDAFVAPVSTRPTEAYIVKRLVRPARCSQE